MAESSNPFLSRRPSEDLRRKSVCAVAETFERLEERRLIRLILDGEGNLFHTLIRPYERRLHAMAFTLLRNEADAKDAAQDALLNAFRNLAGFRGEAKFSTWLSTIVLNEARNRLRRQSTSKTESIDEPSFQVNHQTAALLCDRKELPCAAMERQEVNFQLQEAVAALPSIYREVFLLRGVEEFSIAEAADVLKVSMGLIKVRMHRARRMLQRTLTPHPKSLCPEIRFTSRSANKRGAVSADV